VPVQGQDDRTFSNAGSAVNASSGGSSTGGDQTPDTSNTIPDYGNIYGDRSAEANRAFETAKTNIAAKRSSIFNQYGYNEDGTVNGNNPLGLYQQDRRNDALELQGAQDTALDRGLGLQGLGAQVADAPRYGEDVNAANMISNYTNSIHGTDMDLQNAIATHSGALLDARQAELDNAIANGWMPDGAVDDGGGVKAPQQASAPSANAKSTAKRLAAANKGQAPNNKSGPLGIGKPAPAKKPAPYLGRH
jgi:hypothetical protein